MQRVLIAGTSGSGKSTLARTLAAKRQLLYVELDSLFHGPDWQPRPQFLADVRRLAAGERWVSEWQYRQARPILLARCDTLVWLDFARRTVLHRALRRSFRRAALHEPIFNGNTEGFRDWLSPEHPIRWGWRTHAGLRQQLTQLCAQQPELTVIRLRSPRAARHWLASL